MVNALQGEETEKVKFTQCFSFFCEVLGPHIRDAGCTLMTSNSCMKNKTNKQNKTHPTLKNQNIHTQKLHIVVIIVFGVRVGSVQDTILAGNRSPKS